MSCENTQILLHAYVDGELDLVRSLEIEKHLAGCLACARAVENQRTLGAALRSGSLYYQAPEGLERRVGSALRRAARPEAPSKRIAWAMLAVAASLLLAGIFVDRLAHFGSRRSAQELVAQEVLDSHLRSLMPGHLTDVQSTDQHTVKPWFNGKLDFSPPVTDFAAQGFPLIGGRLDSIDGRTVAVMVYQRRQHLINVYVWPSAGSPDTPVGTATRQGFHILHWTRAGVNWWVASDVNEAELDGFADLLRAGGLK